MTAMLFKFLAMLLVLKISLPETSFSGLPIEICLAMIFFLLTFSQVLLQIYIGGRPSTCAVHPSLMGHGIAGLACYGLNHN